MSKTQIRYGSDVVCYTQSPKMVSKTERYRFVSWDQEGLLTDNPMTLEKVTETHEYTPIFAHEWQCNFISPFGMVYADGTAADKPLWLTADSTVHLKAVADANYAFDVWSDGYEEAERDVTIDQAMFLTATFVEVKEINISYPEGFIVTYPEQLKKGEDLHIVITEEEGNLLYYKALIDSDGNSYETTDITIHDVQKNMNFEMIWANPVIVELNGDNCTLAGMGTYKAYSDVDISCTPDEGYKFVQWSDGDTNATRTITIGEEDIHLVATCEEDAGSTLTVVNNMESGAGGNGKCYVYVIEPQTTKEYEPGETVHVRMYVGLSGGSSIKNNVCTIDVDGVTLAKKTLSGNAAAWVEGDIVMNGSHTVTFSQPCIYEPYEGAVIISTYDCECKGESSKFVFSKISSWYGTGKQQAGVAVEVGPKVTFTGGTGSDYKYLHVFYDGQEIATKKVTSTDETVKASVTPTAGKHLMKVTYDGQ